MSKQAAKNILPMKLPKPAMGKQIEYEIYYGKGPDYKEHKEVNISISKEDSIHWFCRDHKFRVLSVRPDPKDPKNSKAPEPLFYRPFPDDNPNDDNLYANHVNSGPARKIEAGYRYKPVFEFDDRTQLDPHIKTHI
jgi:hypothetical protein